MKLPIQRIDTYTVPASSSIANSVETYVAERVADIVSDLPGDPVLDVSGTPRGDYVEVMIFTGNPAIKSGDRHSRSGRHAGTLLPAICRTIAATNYDG
jgi:hypothetical protein